MDDRLAIISIIVENRACVNQVNDLLHDYGKYIIGRMGVPYPKREINIISVIVDGPNNIISALSGKLGMIENVQAKTMYSKK